MNRRTALFVLASAVPLGGCLRPTYGTALLETTDSIGYTLATGDRLRIIVFGQENLSNIYAVDPAGRISMPLIGSVGVGGMTTAQAARVIEARLREGYLREPKVTVEIEVYRPFFILGEVTTSGQYPYVNGMTAQTAVAIAGGFSPRAERHWAVVTRRRGDEVITAKVPIIYPIRPGDTVVIKERWF